MTRSSTNELFKPFKDPKRDFRSSRKHFKTLSLDELRSPDFNLFSDQEYSEEEVAKTMAETMEQYMRKTRPDYGSRVVRPKIEDIDNFELKGQFLKELRTNTLSGSDYEDANEHVLLALPMSLTGAASRWQRNEPTISITTWDGLKTKFLNKYCPPARTTKKMEEINNFQQEPDENLYQAWERFKELLMKCPQHYLTKMHDVILFYNGLGIPPRQILDSRGAIPSKTTTDAKVAIQESAEYSQKWHNGTSRSRRPYYTKDCPFKEEGKTLDEAYYTQFGGPFQGGGYRAAAPRFYQRNNANPSYQERRQSMEDTLSKFMSESAKRNEENSNLIKEIRALTDVAIQNQGASIKTLEIPIGQMSKVLQERGFGSLPSSTEANPRLNDYCCEGKKGSYGPQFSEAYSKASHINNSIPRKEKDPGSFTLPCFINNICFDNALVDLGASVSVMPLLTYLNLGLGELAHTKLTVELANRKVKYPNGIAKNVLVGSNAKSLRERMELDLEVKLIGETLVINRSLDPLNGDYIELNDLNEPFELRRNQGDDLMPTIEEVSNYGYAVSIKEDTAYPCLHSPKTTKDTRPIRRIQRRLIRRIEDIEGEYSGRYQTWSLLEVLEAKTVNVLKVCTEYNVADALTKVVPGRKLQHCLELLSIGVG
ncbi:hypothetical protein Tco_0090263 [Tanacetum coccineum]